MIVCDNWGSAVINQVQVNQGGVPFNNLIADARIVEEVRVDFAAHAAATGCDAETVSDLAGLGDEFRRERTADRSTVTAVRTDTHRWTEGGVFWEDGVPEVSPRDEVSAARAALEAGKTGQRVGW